MALCCNEHKMIFHVNVMTKILLLAKCCSKYTIIYIVLHIYLIVYVMTPLVARLAILKYCISYHHQ